MLIEVSNKIGGGLSSSTNTKLGTQIVYIEVDKQRVGLLSGDDLNAQLIAQGFEIVEVNPYGPQMGQ